MALKHQIPLPLLVLFFCVALVPSEVSASRFLRTGFIVQGRVFCDTCQAGFETPATTYIAGARVRVECKERATGELKYSAEDVTDHTGIYKIQVADEHTSQVCDSVLVSSPQRDCATVVPGRDRSRVVLTHNNGIASDTRFANSLGFHKDTPLAWCAELMKQYEQYEV